MLRVTCSAGVPVTQPAVCLMRAELIMGWQWDAPIHGGQRDYRLLDMMDEEDLIPSHSNKLLQLV